MASVKQLDRLKHIYNALNGTPQTIESLQQNLISIGITISSRQLYRDLDDVGLYLLRDGERLEQRTLEFNRKLWLINKNTDAEAINNYDIDTYLIGKAVVPIGLLKGRRESLQRIQNLLANHLNNSKIENNANWDSNSLTSTHFNEVPYNKDFQVKLDEILWATSNRRSMEVLSYRGDSVSLYKSITFPFVFNPLKFIYHRGSFFVAGIIASTKQCLVLDAFQISEYKLSNNNFPVKKQLLDLERNLSNRFGLSHNMDEKVYRIILQFAFITGQYIQTVHWHHSQKFEKSQNGNWKVSLTCGINRELLGWIFHWMGNVKIIEPSILKDYYEEQLKLIHKAHDGENINYSNITQPE